MAKTCRVVSWRRSLTNWTRYRTRMACGRDLVMETGRPRGPLWSATCPCLDKQVATKLSAPSPAPSPEEERRQTTEERNTRVDGQPVSDGRPTATGETR